MLVFAVVGLQISGEIALELDRMSRAQFIWTWMHGCATQLIDICLGWRWWACLDILRYWVLF